jgi:hypothetical protein
MRWVPLALLLVTASAQAQDAGVEPYWQARRAGAVGIVAGRVFAEPRTPTASPKAIPGTTVTLLPRSAALLTQLERLKQRARDSSTAFAAAAPAMRKAMEVYERELLQAGAPDLTPLVLVDSEGVFRIEDVPAGSWLLLAWHSTPVDLSTSKTKAKERGLYQPQPRVQGFRSVTVWLRELSVAGGATVTEKLTDRSVWFQGVAEDKVLDTGR